MSKKKSSVVLKNNFQDYKDLNKIFLDFEKKIANLKSKTFLVAVSGGPDSLGLSALTKALNIKYKLKFHYVLINHNIRKNSSEEANKVKKILKKNKINLKILINKKSITKNIQNSARMVRYKLLTEFCRKKNIRVILTAHNLEDQVETFFIRLSRGSGLTGLSSMQDLTKIDDKVKLYRPLLDIEKKYLVKITKIIFKEYIKDPSNKDTNYLRTKIRALKKPLNQSGISYEQIIKSIKNLNSSKKTLDDHFKHIVKNTIKKYKNKSVIDLNSFRNLRNDVKIRILNTSIKHINFRYYNLRSKKVVNLINNIKKVSFKRSTLGGCLITRKDDILIINKEKKREF